MTVINDDYTNGRYQIWQLHEKCIAGDVITLKVYNGDNHTALKIKSVCVYKLFFVIMKNKMLLEKRRQ